MDTPPLARDLPLGTLCRIGFLLSAAFWMPFGLLLGLARTFGIGTLVWLNQDVGAWMVIPAGLVLGLVMSLFNDVALAIGALLFVVARRLMRR